MDKEVSFRLDERVEIIGRIFQSVGISSVVWGVDALAHHAIFTIKERNDLILPNEDFLRGAEALRLHNFVPIEATCESPHHVDGLEHYAAQYAYPPEITEKFGDELTVAMFPASVVGWKLAYIPISDLRDRESFTTGLAVEKIPIPVEFEMDQSFVQLSRVSSASDVDAISVTSGDTNSTIFAGADDEYVVIRPVKLHKPFVPEKDSVAMEREDGPNSPDESVCDIADTKAEEKVSAVEMLPGQKKVEKPDELLIKVNRGMYIPRRDLLKESFQNAEEFLERDRLANSKFGKVLKGWDNLLTGRPSVV